MNKACFIFFLLISLAPVLAPGQKFAVIGDYGWDGIYEDSVARLVKSWDPDFILTTGDNNYPGGADSTIDRNIGKYYHNYIFPYYGSYLPRIPAADTANRFFPTLGNHDNNNLAHAYLEYFTLPEAYPGNERYYTFTVGDVQLIAVNSDSTYGHEPDGTSDASIQALWMKGVLSASSAPWKIVYFHHPPYSSGYVHGSQIWMRWPFAAWGATAVFSGHEHNYERIMVGGFPYFVDGLGGKSIYCFSDTVLTGSAVRYCGNYGAMIVAANPDSITFCFRNIRDSLVDCYTIHKATGVPVKKGTDLSIFPDPFRNQARMQTSHDLDHAILTVYDAFGKQVRQLTDVSGHSLMLHRGNLPCGIYFLRITEYGKPGFSCKFVITD
jgi:tartrate-resistant acid phosphatase type 5